MKKIWTLRPNQGMAVQVINDYLLAHLTYLGENSEHRFRATRHIFELSEVSLFDSIYQAVYWMISGKLPDESADEAYDKRIWTDNSKYYQLIDEPLGTGYVFIPTADSEKWIGYIWTSTGTSAEYFNTEEETQAWLRDILGDEEAYDFEAE